MCSIAACYIRTVTVIYSHNEGESPTENKHAEDTDHDEQSKNLP